MIEDHKTKGQLVDEFDKELKNHSDLQEALVKERTAGLIRENEQLKQQIAELRQAQDELIENDERYRIHFSLTNDVMFSYDNLFRVRSVSPNVERILGYRPEELIGRTFDEVGILHPDYMEEALDNALHILSGKMIYSSIYQFITKNGAMRFGEVSGVPLMKDGRVVEVISVARDITERIEAQELLQKSEETARTLMNASSDSMILLDAKGTILSLNKVSAQRLARSAKELLGSCIFDHMPKAVSARRRAFFEQTISSGRPVRFIDEREGRLYSTSLYPIHDSHERVVRVAAYTTDVTRRRRASVRRQP